MYDLVTVIVPVYNERRFFEDCINSVINQSYQNLEIIVVDDGSNESNAKYYDGIVKKDSRITIFHINNQGVSNARNFGILKSKGKWVTFVDSDDCLMTGAIEFLLDSVDNHKLIIGDYYKGIEFINCDNNENIISRIYCSDDIKLVSLGYEKHIYEYDFLQTNNAAYFMSVWAKLYDGDLIRNKNIRFNDELKHCEDLLFNLEYLSEIQNVVLSNRIVYFYRDNPNSATHKKGAVIIDESKKLMDVFLHSGICGIEDFCAHYLLLTFIDIVGLKDKILYERYINMMQDITILNAISEYNTDYLSGSLGNVIKIICYLWKRKQYIISYQIVDLYLKLRHLLKK